MSNQAHSKAGGVCTNCNAGITGIYFTIGDAMLCESCFRKDIQSTKLGKGMLVTYITITSVLYSIGIVCFLAAFAGTGEAIVGGMFFCGLTAGISDLFTKDGKEIIGEGEGCSGKIGSVFGVFLVGCIIGVFTVPFKVHKAIRRVKEMAETITHNEKVLADTIASK